MVTLTKMIPTFLLVAMTAPLWASAPPACVTYNLTFTACTIPGTSQVVNFYSYSPSTQFTQPQIQTMLNTLTTFPSSQIHNVHDIWSVQWPTNLISNGNSGNQSFDIYSVDSAGRDFEISRLSVGVGLVTYLNMNSVDQTVWNALPGRSSSPINDFVQTYDFRWVQNSSDNLLVYI